MTAKRKRGPPREYDHRVPIPLTSAQLEAIDRAAEAAGLRRAAWMRMVLMGAAAKEGR